MINIRRRDFIPLLGGAAAAWPVAASAQQANPMARTGVRATPADALVMGPVNLIAAKIATGRA